MRSIPFLTYRGFVVVGLALLGPIVGILGNSSLGVSVGLSLLVLLLALIRLCVETLELNRLRKSLGLNLKAPERMFSTQADNFCLIINTDSNKEARIEIRIAPDAQLRFEPRTISAALTKAHTRLETTVSTTALARGHYRVESLWIRVSFRPYLFCFQFPFALNPATEFDVYPNVFADRSARLQTRRSSPSGAHLVELSGGEGREFDRLRTYAYGDDVRRIDWKRSAKRSAPLIKVYRPETHQRVAVALDCSRRLSAYINGRLQLEFAADAVATLFRIAGECEDEVGLFAFNHRTLCNIPCRSGPKHRSLLMDKLHSLEVGALEADYQLIGRWSAENRRRTLLVLITSLSSATSIAGITATLKSSLRRHIPLLVSINDPELEALQARSPNSLDQAFISAAAWEQLNDVRSTLEGLRRSGVECIHARAEQLPSLVAKRYIQLKLSGRL